METTSEFIDRLKSEKRLKINQENNKKNKLTEEDESYLQLKGYHLERVIEEIIDYNIIDDMWHNGYSPKIYNFGYGCLIFSLGYELLLDALKRAVGNMNDDYLQILRSDFLKAKVIYYLEKNNHRVVDGGVNVSFDFVKKDLTDYIRVKEINNRSLSTELIFEEERYFRTTVDKIINSDSSAERKVKQIDDLLKRKFRSESIIIRYHEQYENKKSYMFYHLGPILISKIMFNISLSSDDSEEILEIRSKVRKIKKINKSKTKYKKVKI